MLFALTACSENLFGRSSVSDCGNDIECLQISAEEMFRKGNYKGSYETYKKIVKLDSAASVGYFGMAKVGPWMWNVNPFTIIGLMNIKEDQDPFLNDSVTGRTNKIYKAIQTMYFPLRELDHRDSLTAIWEIYSVYKKYGRDSVIAYAGNKIDYFDDKKDFFERLDNFGADFCQGGNNCSEGKNKFPLSDRKHKRGSYIIGYSISDMLYKTLSFMDMNKDSCITTRNNHPGKIGQTRAQWGCFGNEELFDISLNFKRDDNGNLTIDISEAYKELLENPAVADDFNSNLEDLYNGLGDITFLTNLIGGGDLWESGDNIFGDNPISSIQDELNAQIAQNQSYLLFYKLYDGIDNDGDGCLDEGLPGYDPDGDGIDGEDMRLVSLNIGWNDCSGKTFSEYGKTYSLKKCLKAKENYTLYKSDDSLEMSGYAMYVTAAPESSEDTIINLKFADKNFNPSYKTSTDKDIKLEVQMEKTKDGVTKCYGLAERKTAIGGCWVNYTDEDFRDYRRQMREKFVNRNPDCDNVY